MIIIIDQKPEIGKRERVCRICGETYFGGNFVCCLDCEATRRRFYEVAHVWQNR